MSSLRLFPADPAFFAAGSAGFGNQSNPVVSVRSFGLFELLFPVQIGCAAGLARRIRFIAITR